MRRRLVLALAAAAPLAVAALPAPPAGAAAPEPRSHVLIGFASSPSRADVAAVARTGATVTRILDAAEAVAADATPGQISALAGQRSVRYVETDEVRHPLGLSNSQLVPDIGNGLYGLVTTRAVQAQAAGATGAGVKACVADTGIDYTHPDLKASWGGGTDIIDGDSDPFWNGIAEETHATHVAGILLGADNSKGILGVAPKATLLEARVLGSVDGGEASGTASQVMAGVQWLVDHGCQVVNLSLGGGNRTRAETTFYAKIGQQAVIVAASGNESRRTISYPAGYDGVVSVGAVDRDDQLASFSNTGKGLDLSAPGVDVLSSVPAGQGSEASVTAGGTSRTAYGMEYAGRTGARGVSGPLVDCGLAGTADTCTGASSGFVALIQRGSYSFAQKVTNVMAQGAAAAIVYNNVPGDLTSSTLGSAGDWIPAVGVSDTAGAALLGQVGGKATVVNAASSWDTYSGTSMATPHVSGVAALVLGVHPGLSAGQVAQVLTSTARDVGPAGYDTSYGAGIVDALAAVQAARP
jgi:subtilisin family serine protease